MCLWLARALTPPRQPTCGVEATLVRIIISTAPSHSVANFLDREWIPRIALTFYDVSNRMALNRTKEHALGALEGLERDIFNNPTGILLRGATAPVFALPSWVQGAKSMNKDEFNRTVEFELGKSPKPQAFGECFDPAFRNLEYTPANHEGVLFLFGIVSGERSFVVYLNRVRISRSSSRPPLSTPGRIRSADLWF